MRVEEYRLADGSWTISRREAIRAAGLDIASAVLAASTAIPHAYFMGTAQHESNYALNERDTEESGFQTFGIYQLSTEEAASVGMTDADLFDLSPATAVLARISERRVAMIRQAAQLAADDDAGGDLWSYLALAHNQGLGACLLTIKRHGLDWAAYKARNPSIRIVTSGYGDDVRPAA